MANLERNAVGFIPFMTLMKEAEAEARQREERRAEKQR
jgi:hypothetical protein